MEKIELRPAYMVYPGLYPLLMLNYWLRRTATPVVAILISDFDIRHKGKSLNFFEMVIGLWQETGFLYMLYMLMIAKFAVPLVRVWSWIRRLTGQTATIKTYDQIARERGIPIFRSKDFNGEETRMFLKNVNANILVSAYNNQILKPVTYRFLPYRAVNIHPALLPNFRGLDAPFEAMFHNVKHAGVTLHWVDSKIDTGEIILQSPVRIRSDDTLYTLSARCWMHGAKLLEKVFDQIRSGTVTSQKQNPKDILYPYQSFPHKDRVKSFGEQGKKMFRWKNLTDIFVKYG